MVESLLEAHKLSKGFKDIAEAMEITLSQLDGDVSLLGHYGQCLIKSDTYEKFKKCVLK
ncbi:hypothetical protein LCGC14_0223380 [marine sediment metagenome]|uniref:Uncharacterized protein n=1 Tax=marine sediment metagenome TaxID=412755 RepID=A0A0F9UC47_9ZZZZ